MLIKILKANKHTQSNFHNRQFQQLKQRILAGTMYDGPGRCSPPAEPEHCHVAS